MCKHKPCLAAFIRCVDMKFEFSVETWNISRSPCLPENYNEDEPETDTSTDQVCQVNRVKRSIVGQ